MNIVSSREQVYTALLAFLEADASLSTLLKTFTRRLKHWADVPPESQPALYMQHSGEIAQIVRGQPTRIVLELNMWIYVFTDGDPTGPIINPILDALGNSLEPKNDGDHTQTLNGLVHHCWIEGATQIFEGDLDTEAVAIVPIKILIS